MSSSFACDKISELATGCSITAVSAAGGRRARDRHSAPRIFIDISIFLFVDYYAEGNGGTENSTHDGVKDYWFVFVVQAINNPDDGS